MTAQRPAQTMRPRRLRLIDVQGESEPSWRYRSSLSIQLVGKCSFLWGGQQLLFAAGMLNDSTTDLTLDGLTA